MDSLTIRVALGPISAEIAVPGSKSITNRALVLAALADGDSTLDNALFSDDSKVCVECLRGLGIAIEADEEAARIVVHGLGGVFPAKSASLFVGNSGTTARFVTAAATLGHGDYHFDGVPRMRQRPVGNLLKALRALGADITSPDDCFPLTVHASGLRGGETELDATESSQLLSALLQVAPYAENDVQINVTGTVVSLPYIDITLRMMQQFGIKLDDPGSDKHHYRNYSVRAGQRYRGVRVPHLSTDSLQGDAHFVDVLERMGCIVTRTADYLEVQGPDRLRGTDEDMNAISDTAQTLAAIAPFADSPVTIRNIGHIRHKETDRIAAIVTELRKLNVQVDEFPDGVKIYPSPVRAAAVDTYDDHRMAMAFSVIGLVVPGIQINDPGCTRKTFPDFFTRFEKLYGSDNAQP